MKWIKRQLRKVRKLIDVGLVWLGFNVSGYQKNPLMGLPVNAPCFCEKTPRKKFKNCCKDKIKKVVTVKEANHLQMYVDYVKAVREG